MRTSLTTFDGYPRADIDIAQIRTTRARIIYLRNDHKELLAKIEEGLHKHFAEEAAKPEEDVVMNGTNGIQSTEHVNGTNGLHATNGVNGVNENTPNTPAFAIVNTVSPSSPAETAGLKSGDKIIQFGDVDWLNHEKLSKVAQVVGRNEGRTILVVVERDGQSAPLRISLVPRRDWGGRGTLGCHLKEL
jgi:26S proteasome non-ATPase regulatory subunit 9